MSDDRKATPRNDAVSNQADEEIVNDFDSLKQVAIPKEVTARTIAQSLLQTFRYALWGTLFLGFAVVVADHWLGRPPVGSMVKESLSPMLASVGTFVSTVFGPLLGFVLGYYFGERKSQ